LRKTQISLAENSQKSQKIVIITSTPRVNVMIFEIFSQQNFCAFDSTCCV
jgi:hypothetical protein